ncbi:HAD family hydrolase [Virgibacillus sp. NKC19-16]|uniref:HAD family hydrolase n=1 Tax=Virgibacillus salidurans TaxID=2831673 RepID=UPI001F2CF553|nr:HAD family hydrolase [Virgibacillus sp. NKC19-16]UJL47384.1 HAD family hydrolase [Virgibacillus sp. NKC19-16]
MIKAILFDLDDTLLWDEKSIKEAFKATCHLAGEKYTIDPVLLEENVRRNARALYEDYDTYDFTQMIGINPFEGLWGNFNDEGESFRKLSEIAPAYRKEAWTRGLKDSGVDDPAFGYELAEKFPMFRKQKAFVYGDTFRVLDQLKGNYQMLLLTNGSPELQQTKLDITPELTPYFDQIVVSGAFGKGKPDPTIFEHALELLSVQKDEVLMVGDNLTTDILGASRAGINSVWINRKQKVANEIFPTYEIAELEELVPLAKNME